MLHVIAAHSLTPLIPIYHHIIVSAGKQHTCAVRDDQKVLCWGVHKQVPKDTFIQVSAGGVFSCGITTDNSIECWGSMDEGEGHTSWPQEGSFVQVSTGHVRERLHTTLYFRMP